MKQNSAICLSANSLNIDGLTVWVASRAFCSKAMASISASFSSALNQLAWRGWDCNQNQTNPQSTIEAKPSIRNIHCQPCRLSPLTCSKAPETGPEITEAMAEPLRKIAMALPRSVAGSHWVK
ncbi:hypothetical protein D3C73_1067960 [compost metagenome]